LRSARDARVIDWPDELTANCPRRRAAAITDQCHAQVSGFAESGVK